MPAENCNAPWNCLAHCCSTDVTPVMILENIRKKKCISLCLGRHLIQRLCNQFYGFAEVIYPLFVWLFQSGKNEENILGFKQVNVKQWKLPRKVQGEVQG